MAVQRTGDERISFEGKPIGYHLIDYWRWNASDLLNNTLRGSFCEFIVSSALGLDLTGVNEDWWAYDIAYPHRWFSDGVEHDIVRIEVKSAACLQAWDQNKSSRISFSIRPTKAWSPETGYADEVRRQSDVYVFCLYTETDRTRVDPLKLEDWVFYVISTKKLDDVCGPQKTISLSSLLKLDDNATGKCTSGEARYRGIRCGGSAHCDAYRETPPKLKRNEKDADTIKGIYTTRKMSKTTVKFHDIITFHLTMQCFWCRILEGDPVLKEHESAQWLSQDALDTVDWLPADRLVLPSINMK